MLDLDGTLVDSSEPIVDGILAQAAAEGLKVPTREWALGRIGHPPLETWALLGAQDPEGALQRFRKAWLPRIPEQSRALPGAADALDAAAERGITLTIATTRETASAIATLAAVGLDRHLSMIVGADKVARPKPAPDVLKLILESTGTPPSEALMVGDTTADVLSAHAAGLPCWAALNGPSDEPALRDAGAERILYGGIGDLPRALDEPSLQGAGDSPD